MSEPPRPQAGPTNSIVDVRGIRVGQHTAVGDGWLTGTTVVLPPPGGAVASVDVRGGGPGTRETDLLDPRNAVHKVNAIMLGGGSAFGLSAADGVMGRLSEAGEGVVVDTPTARLVVPIVPAAILFDLGRGGDPLARPDASFGAQAYDNASETPPEQGNVGAGTGAVAGGLKGGIGTASTVLADGATVGALVAVNSAGRLVDPATGRLYGAPYMLPGELPPFAADRPVGPARPPSAPGFGLNTTIGVVATDATLTKAECAKLAGVAQDGIARAAVPAHTMFDGDTVFAMATGTRPAPDQLGLYALQWAATDCLTRAMVRALLAATSVRTPAGAWPSYPETMHAGQ